MFDIFVFNYKYTVKVGVLNAKEIDFVCEKDDETLYFQVAETLD